MLEVYIKLVGKGDRTLESIPTKYRQSVKEALGL